MLHYELPPTRFWRRWCGGLTPIDLTIWVGVVALMVTWTWQLTQGYWDFLYGMLELLMADGCTCRRLLADVTVLQLRWLPARLQTTTRSTCTLQKWKREHPDRHVCRECSGLLCCSV